MNFSVLLSLYIKESPDFLRSALASVFEQTVKASEVVLVEDGPITEELSAVVEEFAKAHEEMKVVKLLVNGGLGHALNIGLEHCTYDLVARMDTDDICKPNRFEKQLKVFETNTSLDVCGSWIDEFEVNENEIVSTRRLPEFSIEIFEYGKRRNPVNHVTVMFRKEKILRCGGYQDYPLFEDYFLWARMLVQGYNFYTIQESLVYVRASMDMIKRRGGVSYAITEIHFQFLLFGLRYIGIKKFVSNIIIRSSTRIMPKFMRAWIYKKKLRSKSKQPLN